LISTFPANHFLSYKGNEHIPHYLPRGTERNHTKRETINGREIRFPTFHMTAISTALHFVHDFYGVDKNMDKTSNGTSENTVHSESTVVAKEFQNSECQVSQPIPRRCLNCINLHMFNCFTDSLRISCFHTRAVCKVRGLAAVRRYYAEGGGDCYTKL